jgi:hypothetical protein
MNLLGLIILLIIVSVCFLIGLREYKRISRGKFSGEDVYQEDRREDLSDSNIYTTIYLKDDLEQSFSQTLVDYKSQLTRLIRMNLEGRELEWNFIRESDEEESKLKLSELWELLKVARVDTESKTLTKSSDIFTAKYSPKLRRITFIKDHRYFGGLFFLKMAAILGGGEPVSIHRDSYRPVVTELLMARFAFYWLTCRPASLRVVESRRDIKRVAFTLDYSEISSRNRESRKQTVVMLEILSPVINSTGKESLNVLIPVAFECDDGNYNNVGAIVLDYEKDDTYTSLESKLKRNKYQAEATHGLQRILNKGKEARNSMDVVLSTGCVTSDHDSSVKKSYTSYLNVAHYPIYILSMSTIGKVCHAHVTVTIMTEDICLETLLSILRRNESVRDVELI